MDVSYYDKSIMASGNGAADTAFSHENTPKIDFHVCMVGQIC
jgi:hypothetical protein